MILSNMPLVVYMVLFQPVFLDPDHMTLDVALNEKVASMLLQHEALRDGSITIPEFGPPGTCGCPPNREDVTTKNLMER
jgi:hypothetical protein